LLLEKENMSSACRTLFNLILFEFMYTQRGQRCQLAVAFASSCRPC